MSKDVEMVLGDLLNAIGLLIDGATVAINRLDPEEDATARIHETIAEAVDCYLAS